MQRVLFVNQFAITPDHSSGTRHFLIARELARLGYHPTIVASEINHHTGNSMSADSAHDVTEKVTEGVRFIMTKGHATSRSKLGRLIGMLDFARQLWTKPVRELIGDYDVVYGSSPHLFAATGAYLLASRAGKPFILEIRDVWPKTLVDLGNVSPLHPLVLVLGFLERHLYRNADHIVTLLPSSADHICAHGGSISKISVVPNFVDAGLHPGLPKQTTETFTIMYAGAHGIANTLDTVLDSAGLCLQDSKLAAVRFVLIGDGPEKPRLKSRVTTERLVNVEMRDAVPKRQIGSVMADADAFLMPLKASSVFMHGISPNKLFDYMAAARPTIFAVDTPTNLIAKTNSGVTVQPEDPTAYVEGIRTLVNTPHDERIAMGQRARAYAIQNHSYQAAANAVADVIRRVTTTDQLAGC